MQVAYCWAMESVQVVEFAPAFSADCEHRFVVSDVAGSHVDYGEYGATDLVAFGVVSCEDFVTIT